MTRKCSVTGLRNFDWLHLHHEDFTGQAGRHLRSDSQLEADLLKITASKLGYAKVTEMKLDVAKKIKAFCAGRRLFVCHVLWRRDV